MRRVVLTVLAATIALLLWDSREYASVFFALLTIGLAFGQIAAWWLDLIHLARRLMPEPPRRAVCVGVGVPILWGLLATLILVVVPVIVGYIVVIFASLQ